ncbi:MAG: NADH-quinone oxidoreductase subunit NuoG [Nitrospirae bacterium]|nr:NADH-quinone oxidoreductase subunit NuoG [Nitrospirota bacterium]
MTTQTAVATNTVTLTINGQAVTVEKGTLLIEAAKQAGIDVPHFCYHPKLKPDANCRMCLVEIEKAPKLQTSCNMPAAEGMVVSTNSPKVSEARAGVLEFILANHPLDCPICDKGGECQLQDEAHAHTPNYSQFGEAKRFFEKEYFGPLIDKEMTRCVQCLRCVRYCDEIVDSRALGSRDRGSLLQIGGLVNKELDCEFCGGCIQICPVGALTSRVAMYDYRPWQLKKIDTICPHCADGCRLKVESRDNVVLRITSDAGRGRNNGDLCAKGYFGFDVINRTDRVMKPLVRKAQGLVETSWFEATALVASRFAAIKTQHGGSAIGGIISAQAPNEDLYLFQKFMRLVMGSPNVDSTARYGHHNTVAALRDVVGHGRMTASYEDVERAQALVVIGADLTETNPIVSYRVKNAVRAHGATLVTIGRYGANHGAFVSNLVNRATHPLTTAPGQERAAVLGLIKALVESGRIDSRLSASAPSYVQRLSALAGRLSWDDLAARAGVPRQAMETAAGVYADAQRAVILFGQDVIRSRGAGDTIRLIADLAILAGKLNAPGCGLNPLSGESNEQGAVELGVAPDYLPGLTLATDGAARQRLAAAWQDELPAGTGWTAMEMLEQARAGTLKALYLVGEDPFAHLPASARVREALAKLELLVCQDVFRGPSAEVAHVCLPAASFAEKEASWTNHEGRVQKGKQALDLVGEAEADTTIFSDLARSMGYPLDYAGAREILMEAARVAPAMAPKGASVHPGAVVAATLAQYVSGGFERDVERRFTPPPARVMSAEYPFQLTLVQSLFRAGALTARSAALAKVPHQGKLLVHPDDAVKLGVANGATVRVWSAHGAASVTVRISPKARPGQVLFPEHYAEAVRDLVPIEVDPATKVPIFRETAVAIDKTAGA